MGSRGSFAGWMRQVCWVGESRANASSLWGRRGDRWLCSVNSYNMGEGRAIRVWFSLRFKTLLGFLCSFVP